MFVVSFSVFHSTPDSYDRDKCVAEFNSLTDALTWCGFYHHKAEEPDSEGYYRDWAVRGIFYQPKELAHSEFPCLRSVDVPPGFVLVGQSYKYDSQDYLTSDLSWDEIDALPVEEPISWG